MGVASAVMQGMDCTS